MNNECHECRMHADDTDKTNEVYLEKDHSRSITKYSARNLPQCVDNTGEEL